MALPSQAAGLLARCRFPAAGEQVVAAVSGGADSLALLVLARAAGLDVLAIHVDHGIRPGGDSEAAVVAAAAARWGARFECRRVSVPPGADLEARARRARYDALPAGVLTGHTADDLAETVLLNVCWGAGIDGLAPMAVAAGGASRPGPPVRRPLLALRRAETEQLCASAGLRPVRDPSNDDLRFRRNRVRRQLLPLLGEVAGRDPVPVLARQAALLGDDAALLEELAAAIDPTDTAALRDAPDPLARRAVRRWLRAGQAELHPPSAADVARVLEVAAGSVVACQVAGGRRVRRSSGRLYLDEAPAGSENRR
ncbi:tRNA lysidine(34) synthetase TilS [Acidiferrimicrobium sp. IK]|nr:tRNA lysidine(34) synthetase TilS [Acidiferrimicrobium sp. IK]